MEIKFRVRNALTKEVIGYERVNENGHWENCRVNREAWLLGCITSEDNLIREQFTGYHDKNKVEIYCGDEMMCKGNKVEFSFCGFNINGDRPVGYFASKHEVI